MFNIHINEYLGLVAVIYLYQELLFGSEIIKSHLIF